MGANEPSAAQQADWLDRLARRAPDFLAQHTWDRARLVDVLAQQPAQAPSATLLADPRSE